jgi:hypothetical protein
VRHLYHWVLWLTLAAISPHCQFRQTPIAERLDNLILRIVHGKNMVGRQ